MVKTYAKFDGIQQEIRRLLNNASESVKICVAWFSFEIYAPILEDLIKKDVKVSLIVNNDSRNNIFGLNGIKGLEFKPLSMRNKTKLMHNKFCIIDDRTIITGSYNWSNNSESHFENIIVVKNDFNLIKQFLHEFEDLYCYHDKELVIEKCHCKSNKYNIAILGYESGKYSESSIGLWSICSKNNHVDFIFEYEENFLYSQLQLNNDFSEDEDDGGNVFAMRSSFYYERQHEKLIQSYFDKNVNNQIHGIGWVVCSNSSAYCKGYDDILEYKIIIPYRNAYVRKLVPFEIFDFEEGVEQIIEKHKPII